ncbi:tight adherence protein B [Butyrivibrio proteoclasticus]|uniref:Tight adherence protein B n=1 Tax=Butyrivibrio proteoclasticus TaxID=43305 RepID=A0A1I5WPE2_9FIRM|nr:type II secretion system F family protein [Butyrivibrio proteoclasticus]SFQ21653.1 tight adherence protein B [Butyrivibrio proteoclasticus]
MNLKILKSSWQQALSYRPDISDIPIALRGIGIVVLFGKVFYDSYLAMAILSPLAFFWFFYQKKVLKERTRRLLGIQFKDAIASVLTNLKAGYSVENAFKEATKDIELLYGKKSLICNHLHRILKGLKNNIPLEKLLYNFGVESGNKDILEFAVVFAAAKRSGGNLTDIISRTISVISRKIEVEKEIEVLVSSKRMEARIMKGVPFFIIFYISLTSKGFFAPLYHNLFGIILMTICMIAYLAAYLLSEKIINIVV